MATAKKRLLSGCVDGKPIKVVATATAGTPVHTAVAGTTPGTVDEIWLWAHNSGTHSVVLTIEWGGTVVPDHVLRYPLSAGGGLVPISPGFILQNGHAVNAFATEGDVVTLLGFVNTITD
jgi:hypothetical protein